MAQQPKATPPPTQPERRRSQRLFLVIPVELAWTGKDGVRTQETAETESISPHGALLRVKAHLPLTTEVVLTHHKTRQSTKARVVRTDYSKVGNIPLIAVELYVPSGTFWGIMF